MIVGMPFRRRWHPRAARFALLTLVVELGGRNLTARLDGSLHVMPLAAPETTGYPFLLALIRALAAIAVAAAAWRLVRAQATAVLAGRVLNALARRRTRRAPRLRLWLSARVWLASFASTALLVPRPDRSRRHLAGPLAAAGPLAPHLRAARVRPPLRPDRARLGSGRRVGERDRALRHGKPRPHLPSLRHGTRLTSPPARQPRPCAAAALRTRLRVAASSAAGLTPRRPRPADRRPSVPTSRREEVDMELVQTSSVAGARSDLRTRVLHLLGPLTVSGGDRLGARTALPDHAPAPAPSGLLVARRRAAASSSPPRASSSTA